MEKDIIGDLNDDQNETLRHIHETWNDRLGESMGAFLSIISINTDPENNYVIPGIIINPNFIREVSPGDRSLVFRAIAEIFIKMAIESVEEQMVIESKPEGDIR